MQRYILLFLSLWAIAPASAGEQWASEVIKYSSQATGKAYSARQVLGKPNALQYGKNPVAWAPAAANLGLEYVEVGFPKAEQIQQVAVFENFNPGAIYQIYFIESSGKSHLVFEQDTPEKLAPTERVFRYMTRLTSYKVARVKLVLNTAGVYGLNQIDAIGISSSSVPMQSVINNPTDNSFVGKPENLGPGVNSEDPDMLPILSVDGEKLYFARKYHVQNTGAQRNDDIYLTERTPGGGWTQAVNVGPPLNNQYNNFVCAVNPDGTELLLSGRYEYNGKAMEGLHRSSLVRGKWGMPQPIIIENYNNQSPFVCYHVSPDMKYLVIAMEHSDSYGDMDIYVSFQKGEGRYSTPVNLGPVINTAGTEPSVFLSADGKTIYFASDGHPGYGAYDMFMSRRLDNSWKRWSEPVNLGKQINSPDWDLYYTVPAGGEYAYYSSEHKSYGRSDIYRIKLPRDVRPEIVAYVQPSFVNVKTNTPIESLEQQKKVILLDDESEVDLYAEVKGYYPMNTSPDLSAELEDVDDFGNKDVVTGATQQTDILDRRMEDLLSRLQELKKQEASTDNQYEQITGQPTGRPQDRNYPPAERYTSDLDDQMAALRSDMEKLQQSQQSLKPGEKEEADEPSRYTVRPGTNVDEKEIAAENAFMENQSDLQRQMEEREEAISNFRQEGAYRTVSPRSAPTRQYYDLRETQQDDFGESYRNYRDEIEALKLQKDKAAYASQPLTKEALQRTGIDDAKRDELVASSLNTELDQLRQQKKQETPLDPEVEAYRKKLAEVQQKKEVPVSSNGTRLTPREQPEAGEVSEEVLAFQEKLEAMKAKMDNLPKAGQPETAGTTAATASGAEGSTEPVSDPIAATPQEAAVPEPVNNELTDIPAPADTASLAVALPVEVVEKEEPSPDLLLQEIAALGAQEDAARQATETALTEKEAAEAARLQAQKEKELAEEEKRAMEAQKLELQDILAQLEAEKLRVLEQQQKMESDRKALEKMRLDQHLQVKKLEEEIAALEQKKKAAVNSMPTTTAGASTGSELTAGEIFLMPVEEGVTVEIRNVFFNANSAYIKAQSYRELDKVATFLKVNRNISVEVGGHTNGLCDDRFCNSLSEKRARSVSEYLASKGVDSSRLTYKGYGKTQPVADDDTNEGRKQNQRVELKILKVE